MNCKTLTDQNKFLFHLHFEPPHDKTNKMACVPSEDSDQPGHQSLHCPHEESLVP